MLLDASSLVQNGISHRGKSLNFGAKANRRARRRVSREIAISDELAPQRVTDPDGFGSREFGLR